MVVIRAVEAVHSPHGNRDRFTLGNADELGVELDAEIVAVGKRGSGRRGGRERFGVGVVIVEGRAARGVEFDAQTGALAVGFGGVFEEVYFVFEDGVDQKALGVVGHFFLSFLFLF